MARRGEARLGLAGQGKGFFEAHFGRMMMGKADKVFGFQDGLPTGPDVTVIRKQWPSPKIGEAIAYEDVATLLGIKVGSNRWRSVTNAWRARELEEGRVITCVAGERFVVATAEQITAATYGVLAHVGRTAKKQRRNLATVRAADAATRNVIDHQARLMIAVEQDARKKRMNLLPATQVTEAPRITPPVPKQDAA